MNKSIKIIELGIVGNKIIFPKGFKVFKDTATSGDSLLFSSVYTEGFRYAGLLSFNGEKELFMPGRGIVTYYKKEEL